MVQQGAGLPPSLLSKMSSKDFQGPVLHLKPTPWKETLKTTGVLHSIQIAHRERMTGSSPVSPASSPASSAGGSPAHLGSLANDSLDGLAASPKLQPREALACGLWVPDLGPCNQNAKGQPWDKTHAEIAEQAKHEAKIEHRIAELRREGLWSLKRLNRVQEPTRPKTHWDYLCEEMQWLSADFAQERRWKRGVARKVARTVLRFHEEQRQKEERAKRDEQAKLRRIASTIAKEVKQFWTNVEKVVQFKQQSRLEEKRKKALDLQLDFIVGQTEKYSDLLSQSLNESLPASKPGSSQLGSSLAGSTASTPPVSGSVTEDEDFEPHEEEDDEETIEVEEKQAGNDAETRRREIELLRRESELCTHARSFQPPQSLIAIPSVRNALLLHPKCKPLMVRNMVHLVSTGGHHIIGQPAQLALIQAMAQQNAQPAMGVQASLQTIAGAQSAIPGAAAASPGLTVPFTATQVPGSVVTSSSVMKIVVRQAPKEGFPLAVHSPRPIAVTAARFPATVVTPARVQLPVGALTLASAHLPPVPRPLLRVVHTPAVNAEQAAPAVTRLVVAGPTLSEKEDAELPTLRPVMARPPAAPPAEPLTSSTSPAALRPRRHLPAPPAKSPFKLEALEEKRRRQRQERLDRIVTINERRCAASPVYGTELLRLCVLAERVTECSPERAGWRGLSYTHCLAAQLGRGDCRPDAYWRTTRALDRAVRNPEERIEELADIIDRFIFVIPPVEAPAIQIHVSHPHPSYLHQQALLAAALHRELSPRTARLHRTICNMRTQFPDLRLIQYDCGKLQVLDVLLRRLKVGGHRVLLFTQMTRMLDILEQFLNFHGHIYLRLDGSTKVEQRQILMDRFNADKRIFCFILSTRSGGVGVNLTGADTVLFYDSDWNPTMDAQAQDRCHRIGQTRDVHIYRLISDRTVEENILKKANQKRMLGDLAIEGGHFTTAFFKEQTIRELFDLPTEEPKKEPEPLTLPPPPPQPEEEDSMSAKQTQILEQALCRAEDEEDIQAASQAKAEQVAELAEFNENIPLDGEDSSTREEEEELSKAEQEIAALVEQLTPIERYAMNYLEASLEAVSKEELKQAEEQVEAARKDLDQAKDEVWKWTEDDERRLNEELHIRRQKKARPPAKPQGERPSTRMSERLRGARLSARETEKPAAVVTAGGALELPATTPTPPTPPPQPLPPKEAPGQLLRYEAAPSRDLQIHISTELPDELFEDEPAPAAPGELPAQHRGGAGHDAADHRDTETEPEPPPTPPPPSPPPPVSEAGGVEPRPPEPVANGGEGALDETPLTPQVTPPGGASESCPPVGKPEPGEAAGGAGGAPEAGSLPAGSETLRPPEADGLSPNGLDSAGSEAGRAEEEEVEEPAPPAAVSAETGGGRPEEEAAPGSPDAAETGEGRPREGAVIDPCERLEEEVEEVQRDDPGPAGSPAAGELEGAGEPVTPGAPEAVGADVSSRSPDAGEAIEAGSGVGAESGEERGENSPSLPPGAGDREPPSPSGSAGRPAPSTEEPPESAEPPPQTLEPADRPPAPCAEEAARQELASPPARRRPEQKRPAPDQEPASPAPEPQPAGGGREKKRRRTADQDLLCERDGAAGGDPQMTATVLRKVPGRINVIVERRQPAKRARRPAAGREAGKTGERQGPASPPPPPLPLPSTPPPLNGRQGPRRREPAGESNPDPDPGTERSTEGQQPLAKRPRPAEPPSRSPEASTDSPAPRPQDRARRRPRSPRPVGGAGDGGGSSPSPPPGEERRPEPAAESPASRGVPLPRSTRQRPGDLVPPLERRRYKPRGLRAVPSSPAVPEGPSGRRRGRPSGGQTPGARDPPSPSSPSPSPSPPATPDRVLRSLTAAAAIAATSPAANTRSSRGGSPAPPPPPPAVKRKGEAGPPTPSPRGAAPPSPGPRGEGSSSSSRDAPGGDPLPPPQRGEAGPPRPPPAWAPRGRAGNTRPDRAGEGAGGSGDREGCGRSTRSRG
ncbi:helicase SRCAP-like [Carcharodon carcharias]|uniref:helicase SRCAP-like n=1 Tax=Carcharodon carcharias TaxID=13397 RepID=UPI001B7DCDA0|nr:helicase SRCAP-like [Carcharodon carcharias]